MGRRPLANRAELTAHLQWLRHAIHDRKIDTRLVFEGLLDALVLVAEIAPGPDRPAGPPAEAPTGPTLQ